MPDNDNDSELNAIAESAEALAIDFQEKDDTDLIGFLRELKADVESDVSDRMQNSRKQVIGYQLRRNQIGKKDKNSPFPNSSDLRFPIAEMKIREKKPGDVAVVWNAPKIVRYSPYSQASAQVQDKLEHFNNYLYRCVIPRFVFTLTATSDKKYEAGKAVAKVTWMHRTEWRTKVFLKEDGDKLRALLVAQKFQASLQQAQQAHQAGQDVEAPDEKDIVPTRQELIEAFAKLQQVDLKDKKQKSNAESTIDQYLAGDEYMTWMTEEVVEHRPAVELICENQSLIVPAGTTHIGQAERICHEMFYNKRELLSASEENGGDYQNVTELIEYVETPRADMTIDRREMESVRNAAEGLIQQTSFEGDYRIWEVCCWIPRKHISRFLGVGGDEETPVRAVVTFCPDVPADQVGPLRMTEFPYEDFNEWNYHSFTFNYRIDREYDPQGIPEHIDPFVREFSLSKNASIDRTTLTLSPPVLIWDQSGITPQQYRQVSQGLKVECLPEQAVHMPSFPNLKDGFEMDANSCMVAIDKLLGTTTESAFAGRVTSPTKAEVMTAAVPANSIEHLEHTLWLSSWTGVFRQVHKLCKQYWFLDKQGDSFTFARTDTANEFVTVKKEDFDGEWIIQAGGDPSKEDPGVEFQKKLTALTLPMSYPPIMPAIKDGAYDLVVSIYNYLLGTAQAGAILNDRQAAQAMQQQLMQMAAQNLARQQEGKRPQRKPKLPQVPGQGAAMMVQ